MTNAKFEKVTKYSKAEMREMKMRSEVFEGIITNNKEMLSIFRYTESIAPTSQPVLITGETGVGKELIAKAIHNLSGLKGRFVAVNVAGLDDNVFSDTLFGHVKGAFTGADEARQGLIELAAGGTIFLDEIGDLSPTSQVKLLRLLQEREYMRLGQDEPKKTDARLVSVTNADLWALQRAGKFRKDLNFRLRTHHIYIPPLRDRMDDIPILVDHFLTEAAVALNKEKPTCPKELFTFLKAYFYPGNIRELKSMIFDAVSEHKGKTLSLNVFKSHMDKEQRAKTASTEMDTEEIFPIRFSGKLPTIKEATQLLVAEATKRANDNTTIAAGMLGISRQALSKRLKKSRI